MRLYSKAMGYAYVTGRVRVLETRLLVRERLGRLAECGAIDEFGRILAETEYGAEMRQLQSVAEAEELLERYGKDLIKLFKESNVPAEAAEYFQTPHDFANLRVLIKSGFGQQVETRLTELGSISPVELGNIVKERTFTALPIEMADAAHAAMEAYQEVGRFELIDEIIDQATFARMRRLAFCFKSKIIADLTMIAVDLANGRVCLRSRARRNTAAPAEAPYIIGGSIDASDWVVSPEITIGEILDRSVAADYLPAGFWRAFDPLDLDKYDAVADRALLTISRAAGLVVAGPEPVFAYSFRRQIELKFLRFIIVGLFAGLPAARMKLKVETVYA